MNITTTIAASAAAIAMLAGATLLDGPSDTQAAIDTELAVQDAAYQAELMQAQARDDDTVLQVRQDIAAELSAELDILGVDWTPEQRARAQEAARIAALLTAAQQVPPATR